MYFHKLLFLIFWKKRVLPLIKIPFQIGPPPKDNFFPWLDFHDSTENRMLHLARETTVVEFELVLI